MKTLWVREYENEFEAESEFRKLTTGQDVRDDDGFPYIPIYRNETLVGCIELQGCKICKFEL